MSFSETQQLGGCELRVLMNVNYIWWIGALFSFGLAPGTELLRCYNFILDSSQSVQHHLTMVNFNQSSSIMFQMCYKLVSSIINGDCDKSHPSSTSVRAGHTAIRNYSTVHSILMEMFSKVNSNHQILFKKIRILISRQIILVVII